jgi:hypothetical protein
MGVKGRGMVTFIIVCTFFFFFFYGYFVSFS